MFPAGFLGLITILVILGVALWAIQQFPMDATIARVIRVIVVVLAAILVLNFVAGILGAHGAVLWPCAVR